MLIKIVDHRSIIIKNVIRTTISSKFSTTRATKAINSNLPVPVKSYLNSFKEFFGLQGGYRYQQHIMARSSINLYLCIQKQIDYDKFFEVCKARDVFFSFCLVTFLHVWLVSVRLADEGRSGKFVRNKLIEAMYNDISERMKKLGPINMDIKKQSAEDLTGFFQASLFGYDEGILSNDLILASSIWRHLLEMREIEDYSVLNKLCDYVRKNIHHLDKLQEIDLLKTGIITFIPLEKDTIDHSKVRENLQKYINFKD